MKWLNNLFQPGPFRAAMFNDPSSGQPSVQRWAYEKIILAIIVMSGYLIYQGKGELAVSMMSAALVSTGLMYAANSVAGVVERKGQPTNCNPPVPVAPSSPPPPSPPQSPGGIP